jgi:hypothetical protein
MQCNAEDGGLCADTGNTHFIWRFFINRWSRSSAMNVVVIFCPLTYHLGCHQQHQGLLQPESLSRRGQHSVTWTQLSEICVHNMSSFFLFTDCSFNDIIRYLDYSVSNGWMILNYELEIMWNKRTVFFWTITQWEVVTPYRSFGTTYRSYFQDPWKWDRQFVPKRRWVVTTTRCV